MTPVQRILPNAYSDQLISPRRARNGGFLPSARIVSNTLTTNDAESTSRINTAMLMALGQFIDHDFAHSPSFPIPEEEACCGPVENRNEQCIPIEIPSLLFY